MTNQALAVLTETQRELAWDFVLEVMRLYKTRNERAVILQNAISELGLVPDDMGDKLRAAVQEGAWN